MRAAALAAAAAACGRCAAAGAAACGDPALPAGQCYKEDGAYAPDGDAGAAACCAACAAFAPGSKKKFPAGCVGWWYVATLKKKCHLLGSPGTAAPAAKGRVGCAAAAHTPPPPTPAPTLPPTPAPPPVAPRPVRVAAGDARVRAAAAAAASGDAAAASYRAVLESKVAAPLLSNNPGPVKKAGLDAARSGVKHVYTLATMLRLTGDARYTTRLEAELVSIAGIDWKGSGHGGGGWLAWAEFAHAAAVGYDWAYANLTAAGRAAAEGALYERGVKAIAANYAGPEPEKWSVLGGACGHGGYNGVCVMNGAALMAAVAIEGTDPAYAADVAAVKTRAAAEVQLCLDSFGPDGVWPEGPEYGNYALRYGLAAAVSAQLTGMGDWIGARPYLQKVGDFYAHSSGPGAGRGFNKVHNWFDAKATNIFQDTHDVWMMAAALLHAPVLSHLRQTWTDVSGLCQPQDLLWYVPATAQDLAAVPLDYMHRGQGGAAATGCLRTSWTDADAAWLSVQANNISDIWDCSHHWHIDSGNFVYEWGGQRWAVDYGYLVTDFHPEDRPTLYTTNTMGHNVVVLGGEEQDFKTGYSTIVAQTAANGTASISIDLSRRYPNADSVSRVFTMDKTTGCVTISDTFSPKKSTSASWRLHTPASVSLSGTEAELSLGGKSISATILAPASGVKWSLAKGPNDKDTSVDRLEATVPAAAGRATSVTVRIGAHCA